MQLIKVEQTKISDIVWLVIKYRNICIWSKHTFYSKKIACYATVRNEILVHFYLLSFFILLLLALVIIIYTVNYVAYMSVTDIIYRTPREREKIYVNLSLFHYQQS